MYCQKCGMQNPEDSTQCLSCGAPLCSAPTAAKTSGLAIAALVLGVLALCTCGITALPAIVCGIIALVKISGSGGRLKGTGMAITGLVLPGLLVLVLPILAVILMPALSQARHVAQRVVCATNLRCLSTAMAVYANDYQGQVPTANQWCDLLMQEAGVSRQSFHCPGAPEGACSYAMNENLQVAGLNDDRQLVAIFECRPGWNQVGGPELLTTEYHKGQGCNIAFADGHVEFVPADELDGLKWTTDE